MNGAILSDKLSKRSKEMFYDVYSYFEWPKSLDSNQYWMDRSLTSVYKNTSDITISDEQYIILSQLETINLFSIFCRGESALLQTILKNTLKSDLQEYTEYLSHFIDEENKHMWFFNEFCKKYGKGLMEVRTISIPSSMPADVERALSFLRVLVFEEIGDYYNVRVMRDTQVPDILRSIHERHHLDEVGHIAIGWKISELLFQTCKGNIQSIVSTSKKDIEKFMIVSIQSFYSPAIYKEIGLQDGYQIRERLLEDAGRDHIHNQVLERSRKRLKKMWSSILETKQQKA